MQLLLCCLEGKSESRVKCRASGASGVRCQFSTGWQVRGASGLIVDFGCEASISRGKIVWKRTSSEKSREDSCFTIRCGAVFRVIRGSAIRFSSLNSAPDAHLSTRSLWLSVVRTGLGGPFLDLYHRVIPPKYFGLVCRGMGKETRRMLLRTVFSGNTSAGLENS